MPHRVTVHQIVMGHGPDKVTIPPNTRHEFTDDEVRELDAHDPPCVRLPTVANPPRRRAAGVVTAEPVEEELVDRIHPAPDDDGEL